MAPVLPLAYVPFTVIVVAERVFAPMEERVLPAAMVKEPRAAELAFRVTVKPPSIVTATPAPGTEAPGAPPDVADQVAVLFQFPVATEKRCPKESNPSDKNKRKAQIFRRPEPQQEERREPGKDLVIDSRSNAI